MFTGIVEAVGQVIETRPAAGGMRLVIETGVLELGDVRTGDSIAVSGVCLTVVGMAARRLEFDVSRETLDRTIGFDLHGAVNLEKALRLSDRLGGHLVSGHVDGVGRVSRFEPAGDSFLLAIDAPAELAPYIARKGSVAINGVSLTVNRVDATVFDINLIPHTLQATNLKALRTGARVNVEIDMLARYAERLLNYDPHQSRAADR